MGPFERFLGAVATAITAATAPAQPPADAVAAPPAVVAPTMPESIPLPRPRPEPVAPAATPAPVAAPAVARPNGAAIITNPFVAPGAPTASPVSTVPAAPAANPFVAPVAATLSAAEPAPPAPAAPTAANDAAGTNPFVAPPGATEPPPALAPVGETPAVGAGVGIPGVTVLSVHAHAGAGATVDPVPLNLPDMLATLGQTAAAAPGDVTPLGFAAADLPPLAGPAGAIDQLLRGGLDAPPAGGLVANTAPLPRANPLPEGERIQVAALPGANVFTPAPTNSRQRDSACVAQLASLALIVTVLPPVEDGACGIATPVDLAQLGTGRNAVTLTPDATVDCHVVGALNAWMDGAVQTTAERLFGQSVTALRVAASYACRGVNNDPTAELSEHAFGRAIDIGAFQLADGTWVAVHPTTTETVEGQFLAEIRADACGTFTTVLGPGVALHDDHFHLDLAVRGRNGDTVYCH